MAKFLSQFDIDKLLGKGTIDSFREYGFFKPDWKGSIDRCNSSNYFGTIEIDDNNILNVVFLNNGKCYIVGEDDITRDSKYDLELIENKWYTECEYPILVTKISTGIVYKATELVDDKVLALDNYIADDVYKYRPAKVEELDKLLYKDK